MVLSNYHGRQGSLTLILACLNVVLANMNDKRLYPSVVLTRHAENLLYVPSAKTKFDMDFGNVPVTCGMLGMLFGKSKGSLTRPEPWLDAQEADSSHELSLRPSSMLRVSSRSSVSKATRPSPFLGLIHH